MFKLAEKNLFHERTRLVISVGGIALAVLLIFVMHGVFAGSEEHAVAYIKKQPAPLWMMQAGVENLHMSTSLLPPQVISTVKEVEGVQEAVGILYLSAEIDLGDGVVYSYVFGIDSEIPFGGPWNIAKGNSTPEVNEIIIDQALAERYGLDAGDSVSVLGKNLKIVGLSQETFGIATSISFVSKTVLAEIMGVPPAAASYILVQPGPLVDLDELADRLRRAVPDANLMTQEAFIASDQLMIRQMGADVIRAMSIVAYVVGSLVIGLTIYTATLERIREFGVLKALGAGSSNLVTVVFAQAYVSMLLGYLLGIGMAYGVATLVVRIYPEMLILIKTAVLVKQLPAMILMTGLAGLMPLGRILHVDPMIVFRD